MTGAAAASGALVVRVLGAAFAVLSAAVPGRADVGYRAAEIAVDHREVPVPLHLWYPAEEGTPAAFVGRNAMFVGIEVHPGARPVPAPAPVVLMSHGSGGNAANLGWIAVELAERGMVVAAPNHPGTTSGDSVPARTVMPWERAWDMVAVLDRLVRDPPGGIEVDPDRVATLGFSLGGHTALRLVGARASKDAFVEYCEGNDALDCGWLREGGVDLGAIEAPLYEGMDRDPRVVAAVAVDPALARATTAESLAAVEAPVLLLSLGARDALPAAFDLDSMAVALPDARRRFVEGAVHFSFLGACRTLGRIVIGALEEEPICEDPGRPRAEIQAELRAVIGGFLEEVLAGDD